jgi:multiple sugar transport system ATP-binding protein
MASIQLKDIAKSYGSVEVLRDINLDIDEGEFIVLVGPSGCGKSTLLRMIAGLEPITAGDMSIGDERVNELRPRDRDIAMVFQSYALYPHMSVERNMGFSLEIRGEDKRVQKERVREAAKILGLEPYLERLPKALSGGQRQRVAMGRAIVRDPKAFLFDEPLSNLDAALRVEMRLEIAKMHKRLSATMIYVTHDQVEALTLADRIVVMNDGHIQQIGTPMELYEQPANMFVAQFIGSPTMNIVATNGLASELADAIIPSAIKDNVTHFGIRPEHVHVVMPTENGTGHISGSVIVVERLGTDANIYLDAGELGQFLVRHHGDLDFDSGTEIQLRFDLDKLHHFDSLGRAIR